MAKRQSGGSLRVIGGFLALSVMLGSCMVLVSSIEAPPRTEEDIARDLTNAARFACEGQIRRSAADPDGIEFRAESWRGTPIDAERPPIGGNIAALHVAVRGRNAFGGMIWAEMTCRMKLDGTTWSVVEVSQN